MILERIAQETGLSTEELRRIVYSADKRYKTYQINKRTGGKRNISHPTPELKFLQRWMNRNLFSLLPIHDAVTSYRMGFGIAENARRHVDKNYLLKIDFRNFFPSIKNNDVENLMINWAPDAPIELSDQDVEIIVRTVCKDGALTIGAPSSPVLSNAILYNFDCFVFGLCNDRDTVYSRYADDIFLSTNEPNRLKEIFERVREELALRNFPRLEINTEKTVFTSRKRKRVVTGLVLTSDCKLSVGRKKKRHLRSLIHRYSKDELPPEDVSYLRGYLSFVISVEPELIDRLKVKYGDELLDKIMREKLVQRKTVGG